VSFASWLFFVVVLVLAVFFIMYARALTRGIVAVWWSWLAALVQYFSWVFHVVCSINSLSCWWLQEA